MSLWSPLETCSEGAAGDGLSVRPVVDHELERNQSLDTSFINRGWVSDGGGMARHALGAITVFQRDEGGTTHRGGPRGRAAHFQMEVVRSACARMDETATTAWAGRAPDTGLSPFLQVQT